MPINECCNLGVVCCETNASVTEVAALMRKFHVGDVVVVKIIDGNRQPIGIVTDRDIVIEAIAQQVDINLLTAGDIMSTPLVTIKESNGFLEAIALMRERKIRRVPVVKDDGILFGIVAADDIFNLLATELSLLTRTIADQPIKESQLRR